MPRINGYINKDTLATIQSRLDVEITKASERFSVDRNLIKAIVLKESEQNYFAIRREPHLKKADWYRKTLSPDQMDDDFAYCSYGFMQILYGVAKHDHGFKGQPFDLMHPTNSINYGTKHLSKQIKRYKGSITDAVAAYNQGNNRKTPDGKYANQKYVDDVMALFDKYTKGFL